MGPNRNISILLTVPALVVVALLFIYPLGFSLVGAFQDKAGAWTLGNFGRAWDLYRLDTAFTVVIVLVSCALIAFFSVAIGGYLTLGESRVAKAILNFVYRWPLFIPFIVAAQCMRTFIARNGMMNMTLVYFGILDLDQVQGFLDWRGIVFTFVWKQTPFVALMVAGAMAGLDRATIEAARNLGASRLRILVEIVVPQVSRTLAVGLVLSFVTMMSVLSVPLMLSGQSPSMLTVNMAWRINSVGDYGTANALGFVSYLMTGFAAWFYLRHGMRERAGR
ncbi:MAG: ABC transporter permease subunit [Rhodospirillales bacterium]|nr:ABC transporter permease subunit [Rhodospirillales bacterium]